jgi:hypothetical protein
MLLFSIVHGIHNDDVMYTQKRYYMIYDEKQWLYEYSIVVHMTSQRCYRSR